MKSKSATIPVLQNRTAKNHSRNLVNRLCAPGDDGCSTRCSFVHQCRRSILPRVVRTVVYPSRSLVARAALHHPPGQAAVEGRNGTEQRGAVLWSPGSSEHTAPPRIVLVKPPIANHTVQRFTSQRQRFCGVGIDLEDSTLSLSLSLTTDRFAKPVEESTRPSRTSSRPPGKDVQITNSTHCVQCAFFAEVDDASDVSIIVITKTMLLSSDAM